MVNDVSIITGIIAIFVITGVFLPFVNEAFGISPEETACFQVSELEEDFGNTTTQLGEKSTATTPESVGSLGFFDIAKSVTKMFFWTCGGLPQWLDIFFLLVRLVLLILIVRLIRSGGG